MIICAQAARLILQGRKTEHREKAEESDLERGEVRRVRVATHRRARFSVQVLEVGEQQLGEVTFRQARAEGFRTRDEFWKDWEERFGSADMGASVRYAVLRVFGDEPRLLVPAARPRGTEKGYTEKPGRAMFDYGSMETEPEALSEEELRRLQGWRPAAMELRRKEPIRGGAERMRAELDGMQAELRAGGYDREIRQTIRQLEHHLRALNKKLAEPKPLAKAS